MTNLFVVTGVCQPGVPPNLTLPRFLNKPGTVVLLWLEFKRRGDYAPVSAAVSAECPEVILRCAPDAIWGSSSIMTSMLAAINVCLEDISVWDRLVFCSIQDAPCQRRLKTPQKCRSKIPQFRRSGRRGCVSVFRWPAAGPWDWRRCWRRDERLGADVLGHEFGMLAKPVA